MARKTIAVCVTGYNWNSESRIVKGIVDECFAQDIDCLCFASLENKPGRDSIRVISDEIVKGENEIFNLLNYQNLDGVIVLGDSFLDENVFFLIQENCRRYGIPLIDVNDEMHMADYNVYLRDSTALDSVMDHIIEVHGCRRIDFIGGVPGNSFSDQRYASYVRSLEKHGIPLDMDRVGWGFFWRKSIECTEEFLKKDVPDAIVCSNDGMAIMVSDYLVNHGYKVPEQIIVTGYDGTDDASECDTSITTLLLDSEKAGRESVSMMRKIWLGDDVPAVKEIGVTLIPGESCGCVKDRVKPARNYIDTKYTVGNAFRAFNNRIMNIDNLFANATSSKELFEGSVKALDSEVYKKIVVCMNSELEGADNFFYGGAIDGNAGHLSDSMICVASKGVDVPFGTEFKSRDYVPYGWKDGNEPVFLALVPCYFRDRSLGYVALEPGRIKGEGDFFKIWVTRLQNNAGSFYMRSELEKLYVRDPLTGLLNRRGMQRNFDLIYAQQKDRDSMIAVFCVDVDNLKKVNDGFGHDAGDMAISVVADAIRNSVDEDCICTRTGGDEFCLISFGMTEEKAEEVVQKLELYCSLFNTKNHLPYKVGCSVGYAMQKVNEFIAIDVLLRRADEKMYKVKLAKKAVRED